MKILYAFLVSLICVQLYACTRNDNIQTAATAIDKTDTMKLNITVGAIVFTASLYDNSAATAFKEKLPLTLNMIELNGNEKYIDLSGSLPANASNPGTIQAGDLMLYGSNTLVLFYKSFSTSYSYTRIGRIDNPSGLASALGAGNVRVRFEQAGNN